MQTQQSRTAWILFIFLVAGCNSTAPGPQPTAPVAAPGEGACSGAGCETAAPELGELSYIFESAAEPTDVAVELDTGAMVEALIPAEGGAITATGSDGTIYTLEIPTDALLNESTIRLTPVAGIAGLPFGGERTYAVQLGPENLSLFNLAVLTITPAEPLPFGEQIVFGFQKAGTDLVLAAPLVDSQEIRIHVLHAGGYGVTRGTLADVPPERRQLGGSVARRLENAVGAELSRLRIEGGAGAAYGAGAVALIGFRNEGSLAEAAVSGDLAAAIMQYEEQVVRPLVAAAGESCAAGELAQEAVLGVRSQRRLLGMDPGPEYPGLFNTVARVCVIEEFEACVEHHRIFLMLPLLMGLERQNQLPGMVGLLDGAIREARDLTIKCLTFRLEFESTGTFDAGDGSGYVSTVTSELILRYSPEQGFILGAIAELVNSDFEFRFADCSVTSDTGGGVFSVLGLSYEFVYGAADEDGSYPDAGISDLRLVYMPGNTSESYTINPCDPMGAIQVPQFPAWTLAFMSTHQAEFTGGGFETIDWEILGGELFAEKEWSLVSTEEAGMIEEGSFELYHTPGQ